MNDATRDGCQLVIQPAEVAGNRVLREGFAPPIAARRSPISSPTSIPRELATRPALSSRAPFALSLRSRSTGEDYTTRLARRIHRKGAITVARARLADARNGLS